MNQKFTKFQARQYIRHTQDSASSPLAASKDAGYLQTLLGLHLTEQSCRC